MPFYELMRLHKHAAGAAGGIVNPALIRLNDLYYELDDACWCKKLASARAVRKRKLPKKVLVYSSKSIALNVIWNLIKVFE